MSDKFCAIILVIHILFCFLLQKYFSPEATDRETLEDTHIASGSQFELSLFLGSQH